MRLFDSHAHINNEDYTEQSREELAQKIEESDVEYVMDVGFDLESSKLSVEHSKKWPWCYAAVGCHPHNASSFTEIDLKLFRGLAKQDKVKAIGEIGFDFYRNLSPKEDQIYCFEKQIELANELKMPIIIHSREADNAVLETLKKNGAFSDERKSWFPERNGKGDARVLLHCYSGSSELAKQYIRLGAIISIAGPITYKNNRKGIEVVKEIPIEYMLIETDAPWLTPEPYRGERNCSCNVIKVAEKIAEIKSLSTEEVAEITCENACHFFDI